ncbi:hypothetical protein Glove_74g284 [Diversispora epigaea]|uniref:Uncharacterized protein n=1 Tax=Diversispora epigaea TaxID=1348612 RepID=A0A397J996_9GLOM|nr:hypothetical protein Glove_74g284 [Diversispora epigaea]
MYQLNIKLISPCTEILTSNPHHSRNLVLHSAAVASFAAAQQTVAEGANFSNAPIVSQGQQISSNIPVVDPRSLPRVGSNVSVMQGWYYSLSSSIFKFSSSTEDGYEVNNHNNGERPQKLWYSQSFECSYTNTKTWTKMTPFCS